MHNLPKIYISPINTLIIKAINDFDPRHEKVGYIVSQRQHTNHGGYINKDTIDLIFNQRCILERDHFCMKEYDESMIKYDASKFDIIHIDPWYFNQYNIQKTKVWLEHFVDYCPSIVFEFGTEDFIKELSIKEYTDALDHLNEHLDSFVYLVCQGGSVVFDLRNTSPINVEKTKSFIDLAKAKNLKIKRHNCDFHSIDELKILRDLGVDAFNFAPEFSVIQNEEILYKLTKTEKEIIQDLLFKQAPWNRWIDDPSDHDKLIKSCLHYIDHDIIENHLYESEHIIIERIVNKIISILEAVK
jgi:hypothetical protein